MSSFDLNNQTAASISTPATGLSTIFVDSADKKLKTRDDAGVVTNYGAAGVAITALTGEVTATGPGSAAATVTNSAVIGKLLTGLVSAPGTILATDTILQAFSKLVNKGNAGFFPVATDGDVVIASNTTLIRDMYYNSLVVNVGATLFTNGFRIFSRNSIENNGIIDRSGADAAGTGTTAGLTAGTLSGGATGGAGGNAAGTAGGASAIGLGGTAGGGGAGSGGAGGAAGTYTLVTTNSGGVEVLQEADRAKLGQNLVNGLITGGTGGGGGGGDGVAGGAGGGGAGVIVLVTRNLFGTGSVIARGGNGFTPAAGNRGGGGAGGGGVIAFVTENDTTLTSLTLNVNGGLGAAGTGTGTSGGNGSIGRIYRVQV